MPRADRARAGVLGGEAGFTLLEMIVVLAVLALLGGLVMARGPQHSASLDLRVASDTVAQTLRLARTRAISANMAVMVRFDVRDATLRVGGDQARSLPGGIGMAVTAIGMAVTAREGQGPSILFLPDGSSSGGSVELAGAGRAARVGVDWLTGRVSVSR